MSLKSNIKHVIFGKTEVLSGLKGRALSSGWQGPEVRDVTVQSKRIRGGGLLATSDTDTAA